MKEIKTAFKGARFDVAVVEVEGKGGTKVEREMIVHPGAVVILPILDEKRVILIRNERFALEKTLWELPAGTLEQGELPIETAGRELIEETGYRSNRITPLTTFYTTPGFCNEMMSAFVAQDLVLIGQQLDETEKIEVQIVEWGAVLSMVEKGEICDGKTVAALLYFNTFYKKKL